MNPSVATGFVVADSIVRYTLLPEFTAAEKAASIPFP